MATAKEFIFLRAPNGRTQRVVAGESGERVAQRFEERGYVRFEPEKPYTKEDARAARDAVRERQVAAQEARKAVQRGSAGKGKKSTVAGQDSPADAPPA